MYGTYNSEKFLTRQEYAYNLYKTIKDTHDFVEGKLRTNRDKMKVQYDKRENAKIYDEGQYVYLWRPKKPGRKHKLATNFTGPYRIIKRISDFIYKIDTEKSRIHDIVPHDLLRLAVNYNPETQGRIDYDPYDELELDHELEFPIPLDEQIEQPEPEERPVITVTGPQVNHNPAPPPDLDPFQGRQLRNRQNIPPPDIYQAEFN